MPSKPAREYKIEKPTEAVKELFCYHCGTKKKALLYCELWMVTACKDCMESHHHSHHKTCKREVPKSKIQEARKTPLIRVLLTRYDGQRVGLMLRLGEQVEMEEHWMGTYILAPQSLVLVREDIATINESILEGLRTVS